MSEDTIVAIATPPGEGGIGIVRLSGPKALDIALTIFKFKEDINKPEPRKLYLGSVMDSESVLDKGLLAYFAAPNS